MRAVFLNQYYPPAEAPTGLLLADVAERLVTAGHAVTVVASRRCYEDPRALLPRREQRAGVSVCRASGTGFGRSTPAGRLADYATFLGGAVWGLLRAPRPDVVVSLTTPPMLAVLGLGLGRARGARTVYWVMDVYPDLAFGLGVLRERSVAGRVLRRLSRWALRRADVVIALGETMAERLRAQGARTVAVVHNWLAGEPIAPLDAGASPLRQAWGWIGNFVVSYSGNLGLAYEFDTLLDAAALLAEQPRVRIAVFGSGPRRAAVEDEARRRRLGNIEFRDPLPREQLGPGLGAGDLHLVTLRSGLEGLLVPSKIYGILAAGRPTVYVGPDAGEVADIVRSGGCGSIVAPGDASGLAARILAYAAEPARCVEEGRRARRLYESRFERELALGRMVGLVERGP